MARILVIEDDTTFLGLLRAHLSGVGHTVETAEDAALGLRAIVADPPDLVILDLTVPYLDGFELLEAVRSDSMTRTLPVVVITGRTDDESYMKATKIGVNGYLTKPVERGELIKAIQEGLKARRPGR